MKRTPLALDPLVLAVTVALGAAVCVPTSWVVTVVLATGWSTRVRTLLLAWLAGHLTQPHVAPVDVANSPTRVRMDAVVTERSRTRSAWSQTTSLRTQPGAAAVVLREPPEHPTRLVGQRLTIHGRWQTPIRNPGARKTAPPVLCVEGPGQVTTTEPGTAASHAGEAMATWVERRLRTRLPSEVARPVEALLLGRSSRLDGRWRQRLRSTGTSHLFAVSGLHVALLAACVAAALALCRATPTTWRVGGVVAAWTLALVVGGRPSVVRAAAAWSAWALWEQRRMPVAASTAAAWVLLVGAWLGPGSLRDLGFQLSLAGVLGLSLAARSLPPIDPRAHRRGIAWARPLARAVWCSFGAATATAPFVAAAFGTDAWTGAFATVVVTPCLPPLLALALCITLAPDGGWWLDAAAGGLATLFDVLARILDTVDLVPGTPTHVAPPPGEALVAFVIALLALHRGRPGIAFLVTLGASGWVLADRPTVQNGLTCLDVGHGQAVVVRHAGEWDLVDGGSRSGVSLGRPLRALGVRRLNRLFVSHPDFDHRSDLRAVLEEFRPRQLVVSAATPSRHVGDAMADIEALAADLHIPLCRAAYGDRLGPWIVWGPPRDRAAVTPNDGSLALEFRGVGGRVLLPGDLEGYPLVELARAVGGPLDLLWLPHHGQPNEGLEALLDATRPRAAVASRAGPLAPNVLDAVRERGIPVHVTGVDGALHVPWKRGYIVDWPHRSTTPFPQINLRRRLLRRLSDGTVSPGAAVPIR